MFPYICSDYLEDNNWEKIGRDLRDKLAIGQIHSWGRLRGGMLYSDPPLTPIPQSFWNTAELMYSFFGDEERRAELVHAKSPEAEARLQYMDLQLKRTEIERTWPTKTG